MLVEVGMEMGLEQGQGQGQEQGQEQEQEQEVGQEVGQEVEKGQGQGQELCVLLPDLRGADSSELCCALGTYSHAYAHTCTIHT
jgi:hypothetical protein